MEDEEEHVEVQNMAVDPAAGGPAEKQPENGYASETVDDEGQFVDAPPPLDPGGEEDDAEAEQRDLEELEAACSGAVPVPVAGTAKTAEAAGDAAVAKLRKEGKHGTPPSPAEKKEEKKAKKEAMAAWVQAQWVACAKEKPAAGAIDKTANSAFIGTDPDVVLRGKGIDKLMCAGDRGSNLSPAHRRKTGAGPLHITRPRLTRPGGPCRGSVCGNTLDCCVHCTLRHANDLNYQTLLLSDCWSCVEAQTTIVS